MLNKLVLPIKSVYGILQCDYSNKAIGQYFSVPTFIMLYKEAPTFEAMD